MALHTNNLLLHMKRILHSSVRLAYESASDYPVVLGIGMLLLFLHKICPSLFTFLISSSPVFVLTALLLGALLSYGEPSAPVIEKETLEEQKKLSPISRISITECSIAEEVQNVAVTHMSRSFESPVVCIEETKSDSISHDTHLSDEDNVTNVSADTVHCTETSELTNNEVTVETEKDVKEICDKVELQQFQSSTTEGVPIETDSVAIKVHAAKRFECQVLYNGDKTSEDDFLDTQCDEGNATSVSTDTVLCAESSRTDKNRIIVEREERVREACEQVELQQLESTITGSCHYEVNNQRQFGELMSACWEPVMRQDPYSDSESDLTESSSDASITDIIPMLDELNPPVDLGTSPPYSTFRGNLNSLSDEDESEEDGTLSSNEDGEEEKKYDGNSWKDFVDPNSLGIEKNGNLESLMERQKAKNVLKFELDRRLMDMQAADAIQKMEEASRFRVQVPSISTPRPHPFNPSDDSEDTVELPQVPDSAPSVLLPWRKPFDIPFDQIVDRDSRLPETWTPRSGFSSTQSRKRENLYVRQSTYLRQHNDIKPDKPEFSEKDAVDYSESNSEQAWDNGKLFGSLEPHIGDEIKILSAAISDACVLEVNHGINEGTKITDSINDEGLFYIQKSMSSTSDVNDSISAGVEQSLLCSLCEEHNNTEKHFLEEDSMSEVNSLFKCRMEEVLVQSISESGIGQPLTVKLEHEFNDSLSEESAVPVIEERSVEKLSSQFEQFDGESLGDAVSDSSCDDQTIQDRPSEPLPVENGHAEDGHSSDCSLDSPVAVKVEGKAKELLTEDGELPVLEASSVEEMNSLFRQLEEAAVPAEMPRSSEHMVDHTKETDFGVLVPDANSCEDANPTFVQLSNGDDKLKVPGDEGEVILD